MENCAIYSHHLAFEQVENIVKEELPKAKVEVVEQDGFKILTAEIKGGLLSKNKGLRINYRQRLNPSYTIEKVECPLTENLAGMANFIKGLPAENPDIQNKLIYKVLSLNCEMGVAAEPSFIADFQAVIKKIAKELDAIVFTSPNSFFNQSEAQQFLDRDLNLALDVIGKSTIEDLEIQVEAKYYDPPKYSYSDEQLARKEKSEKFLQQLNIPVNTNLPGTPDTETISIRSKEDILERIYALAAIALKGEGLQKELLDQFITDKNITGFSPKEQEILAMEELNDHDRAYASWRYESLNIMMCTIGLQDGISLPNEMCDVQELIRLLHHSSREELAAKAALIPTEQIIDELDRTYRMNWACVNARVKGEQAPEALHPSVVYERHYALNWLIQYLDQDWDEVQTNT